MVEKMVKRGLGGLAAMLLCASAAYAANVETMGIGAMNTGQAGAVSAYCDNVFAAYYNPAGLSLIEKPTLSAGAIYYNAKVKVYGWNVETQGKNDNIADDIRDYESDTMDIFSPSLGFAMPVTDTLSFGVAAYTPYGLHVTWDKDPAKSPSSAYAWESYYGRVAVTPTLAYKIGDRFSVGVGVSIGRSVSEAGKSVEYHDQFSAVANARAIAEGSGRDYLLPSDLVQGTQVAVGTAYAFNGDGSMENAKAMAAGATLLDGAQFKMEATDDVNYSLNVGVMYRPIDQLSFGLTYRGRADGDFEGDVFITDATVIDPTTGQPMRVNLDGTVEMKYDHPEQVQAGVRWFASEKLSVEADVTWTGWSVNDRQVEHVVLKDVPVPVVDDAGTITGFDVQDMPSTFDHARDWEDTTAYRLGVAYQATRTLAFRAGYTYDPSPIPDETFEFGWPDTDRNVYTLGLGWQINQRWNLDAVLQHVISTEKRRIAGVSHELNDNYAKAYGDPDTKVYCRDEGILWGAGLTMTYTF